jgi:hypothetical protein
LSERPAGALSVPPAAWLAAFPHFVIAAILFSFWCAPAFFPRDAISTLVVVVIVDVFLAILSLPMASFVFASGPKRTRALYILGTGVVVSIPVLVIGASWLWLGGIWIATANRLSGLLRVDDPTEEDLYAFYKGCSAALVLFFLCCVVAAYLPMPRFGFALSVPPATRLGFDRLFVDPVSTTALGCLYYTAMGISELFENRWAPPDQPRRQTA